MQKLYDSIMSGAQECVLQGKYAEALLLSGTAAQIAHDRLKDPSLWQGAYELFMMASHLHRAEFEAIAEQRMLDVRPENMSLLYMEHSPTTVRLSDFIGHRKRDYSAAPATAEDVAAIPVIRYYDGEPTLEDRVKEIVENSPNLGQFGGNNSFLAAYEKSHLNPYYTNHIKFIIQSYDTESKFNIDKPNEGQK